MEVGGLASQTNKRHVYIIFIMHHVGPKVTAIEESMESEEMEGIIM